MLADPPTATASEPHILDELTLLMKRFGPGVRQRIASRIPRRFQSFFDVDDVMQETYSQAFSSFCATTPELFERWLYRAAENNLKDLIRYCEAKKRYNFNGKPLQAGFSDSLGSLCDLALSRLTSPTQYARRSEIMRLMRDQIASLPERSKRVILYYDLYQWPVERVARELQCSIGAVYMRRRTGIDLMRRQLKSVFQGI